MEEDIKILKELLKKATPFNMNPSTYNAIENVINKLKEDEVVIKEMSKQLYIEGYCKELNCKECNAQNFANCIEQYFREKVKNE